MIGESLVGDSRKTYPIRRELGCGGFGVVYLAEGPSGDSAGKVLHGATDPAVAASFEQAAERGKAFDLEEKKHTISVKLTVPSPTPFCLGLTNCVSGPDAPICQDTPSGGLDVLLTTAEVGHDSLVDLSREEAFQAADDVAFGPASGDASGDVVAGRLVESHPDDDGSREGRVGVSVAASIEAVPTGGHPRRGRDRAGAAALREGGRRTNSVGGYRRR